MHHARALRVCSAVLAVALTVTAVASCGTDGTSDCPPPQEFAADIAPVVYEQPLTGRGGSGGGGGRGGAGSRPSNPRPAPLTKPKPAPQKPTKPHRPKGGIDIDGPDSPTNATPTPCSPTPTPTQNPTP